ncbi:hypothetical protein FSARC_10075 [Fusarium sarcochroum]|uniref:L-arabinitol 4-dehydrogenase n=1 Tax=Fusarium sarcochroum TaxID=1208366 RepID=A0A8H4TQ07_9HYPO|nr:hypothetical protein FSARC_10075 [Fusarium sarcochroum]
MGASCCGKPSGQDQHHSITPLSDNRGHEHGDQESGSPCSEEHDHGDGHVHEDDHGHGGCCDGHSDASSIMSKASTCCGTEERCDEKCIYAIAALECGKTCEDDPGHEESSDHPHEHEQGSHKADKACDSHLQAALNQYSSYLDQIRCICRSAIEQGITSIDTCCMRDKTNTKKNKHRGHKHKERKSVATIPTFKPSGSGIKHSDDVENVGSIETVGFLVSGMDCTSCADKLMRISDCMTGVSNAQVNFVMGKGELDIDTATTNADEVLAFISSVSGFSLSRIIGGSYFLDILAPSAVAQRLASDPPRGVTDVQPLDKKTVRLGYEPTTIGSRDLFQLVKDSCDGLAEPRGDLQLENSRRRLWDQLTKTALAAALTIPVAVVSWSEDLVDEKTEGIVSIVLGTLVQAIAIPEFYRPALSALWYSRTVEMDMLVVISISAAYIYSVIAFSFNMAGKPLDQGQFFETSTMLITLILAGRLIAAFARVQAISAVSLRSKQNNTAVLVEKEGDRDIDARLLQYGDVFKVLPHTRVPTDGIVLLGKTEVDESMLTGESLPIMKQKGDNLIAGTVNGDGTVTAQLTRLPGKNTVTDIAQLVEEAANSKPKLQDLANKVAGWFVPAMGIIAVLIFVIWIACGIEALDYSAGKSVGNAITYTVATLAVACPCALGLAVPMVLVVAGGIAARGGVVIKNAHTTEGARKITDVVFDKTGTITEGELAVTEQVNLDGDFQENLALAKAVVAGGKHPVSAAVEKHLDGQSATPIPGVANIRVVPGAGIEAEHGTESLQAGNARWTKTNALPEVIRLQRNGLTTLVVTRASKPLIAFGLSARVRPEAARVITELKSRNIAVHLVSGDQIKAVEAVAATVGISAENVAGERTPPEKRDYVASLMEDKSKRVLFCGDGTNDAVAVAQANVGAQMGGDLTSSDVTQGAADVILLNGLEGIPFLLDISSAAFRRMYFNFVWSGVYNVLAVTMASGAWVEFRIPPRYAGLGEMANRSCVLFGAGRVRFEDRLKPTIEDPNDVVIRISYVGVCGSDVHQWVHGGTESAKISAEAPLVMGHEASGIVETVGSAVRNLRPGDRVAVEPGVPCRQCQHCKMGRYNICNSMRFAADPPTDGTLARFYKLPQDFAYKIPDSLSLQEAVLVEPLSVAVHVARLAGITCNKTALVQGSGTIGLLVGAVAKAFGAHAVVVSDINSTKLEVARDLLDCHTFQIDTSSTPQAEATRLKQESDIEEIDIVLECTGVESSIQTGMYAAAKGGTLVQVGMGKPFVNIPLLAMCDKEMEIKMSFRYGPGDYETALNLLASGRVSVKGLISSTVPFESAAEAWELTRQGKGIKNLIQGAQD